MRNMSKKYEEYLEVVITVLAQYTVPITIRQLYYRVISDPYNFMENSANAYQNLDAMTVKMRERGDIDWTKIEDRTRGTEGEDYEDSGDVNKFIKEQLSDFKSCSWYYKKPMWETQPKYVEVWVEKDALAKIVSSVTNPYHMVSFPTRGYGSFTTLKESAIRLHNAETTWDWKSLKRVSSGKEKIVLYLGDFDPTGVDIDDTISQKVAEYGGGDFEFKRIGLTLEQVREYNLQPNYAKISDTRAAKYITKYGKETWELDALPPDVLTKMIKDEVEKNIDFEAWKKRGKEIIEIREGIDHKIEKMMESFSDGNGEEE